MLIGQRQVESVGAGLCQDILERLRQVQVVLELVKVQVEVAALVRGDSDPALRRLPDPGDDEGA